MELQNTTSSSQAKNWFLGFLTLNLNFKFFGPRKNFASES